MTIDDLKIEAKKLGYRLSKIPEKVKKLPCPVCGRHSGKDIRVWYHVYYGKFYMCECGFRSEKYSKSEVQRRKDWNEAVEEYIRRKNETN